MENISQEKGDKKLITFWPRPFQNAKPSNRRFMPSEAEIMRISILTQVTWLCCDKGGWDIRKP